MRKFIEQLSAGAVREWEKHYTTSAEATLPSVKDVEYMVDLLRPEFDSVVSSGLKAEVADEQQIQLTKEQYNCLDMLEENRKILIT